MDGVGDLHLDGDLVVVPTRAAARPELARVHSPTYLDEPRPVLCEPAVAHARRRHLRHPRVVGIAARLSAGAGLVAIEALRPSGAGRGLRGGPTARPPRPGRPVHGLLPAQQRGRGRRARWSTPGERVLIVDWDVHHGNGTQALFWDEPGGPLRLHPPVALLSRDRSGHRRWVGRRPRGSTVNVPLPPGATGDVVRRAFDELVTRSWTAFAPTWVLVSAGFDAHRDDPLADLALSAGDFAELATVVAGYAPAAGRTGALPRGRVRAHRAPVVGDGHPRRPGRIDGRHRGADVGRAGDGPSPGHLGPPPPTDRLTTARDDSSADHGAGRQLGRATRCRCSSASSRSAREAEGPTAGLRRSSGASRRGR